MKVSRSCYYGWLERRAAASKRSEDANRVKKCFYFHSRRYGSRRIAVELGLGRFLVRRLMREQGLVAIQPKRFRPQTTDSRHNALISPNLLKDAENHPKAPGEAIVGDITYLRLINGLFCYLAVFQDKFTRRIVGWAVAETLEAEMVVAALAMAFRRGLIKRNAIIHTDRGSQYVSKDYRDLLGLHDIRQSMSGKGNCYDNAQAESFFSRFKTELVEGGVFESVGQARSEAFSYIEGYYNRIRLHSGIGYLSPIEFERRWRIDDQTIMSEVTSQPVKQTRAMLASNPPRNNRPETHP
ncbi:MAG: IS3 family transposase [Acidobacteria bacterium]|nr:IS3 family transposase [Acidobacteriota bacterium]